MKQPYLKHFLKAIFINFLFLTFCSTVYSQDQNTEFTLDKVVSVKTPDVAAMESVNFLPVNEYTGRINVNIPIYSIDLDGLSIPISISYNSGGVKVNSISSRVGLNWSLNAGGAISREVKDRDDLIKTYEIVENDVVYSSKGFLISNYSPNAHTIWEPGRDGHPDQFFVTAPGLSTTFSHKSDATPFELEPQGNKVETTVTFESQTGSGMVYRFNKFTVTNANGYVYEFNEKEDTYTQYDQYNDPHTELHVSSGGGNSNIRSSSIHLASITSPTSNRMVQFEYDSLTITDHDPYIERKYDSGGNLLTHTHHFNSTLKVKLIKKISFPSGEVNFYYGSNRLDQVGEKNLERIEVTDNFGKLIKKIHFTQSYFTTGNCSGPECYRLKLDEVYYTNVLNETLPGYKFTYNSPNSLPERRSYQQDFMGYYNGATSSVTNKYVPQLYYKADSGRESFLPFNLSGQGYTSLYGTYSLTSNLTDAQTGSLEKIEYPTGGYATMEYELNSFNYLGQQINGGGLRIKKHQLFDVDNSLQREINYSYTDGSGSTSGSILFVPRWAALSNVAGSNTTQLYQRSLNPYELTKNSYVGYSRVEVEESGNGYIVKEFTAPSDFPNSYPDPANFTYYIGSEPFATTRKTWLDKRVSNGAFPNIWTSNEIKRGKLTSEKVYSATHNLLEETQYQYNYQSFGSIGTHNSLYYPDGYTYYDDPFYLRAYADINIERNTILQSINTKYLLDGNHSVQTDYTYTNEELKPFLSQRKITDSDGNEIKEILSYPYDETATPEITTLINENRIASPAKTEKYNAVELVNTNYSTYKTWTTGTVLPEKILSFTTDILDEDGVVFHDYDDVGNAIEVSQPDGAHIVYIWGYNKTLPIAKIENATGAETNSLVANLQTLSDADNDRTQGSSGNEGALRDALNNLRTQLPNALITTYTYDPLIGITSTTDPSGYTTYYEYDDFNRLKTVRDANGKLLSENEYHYQNQQ